MLFRTGTALLVAWLPTAAYAAPGFGWKTVTVTDTVTHVSAAAGTCSASSSTTSNTALSPTSSSTATSSSASATSYPSTTYPTTPAYPICTSHAPFASIDHVHPRLFNYNGTGAKYFAGTNAWWTSYLMVDSDVDLVFSEIKNTQLQVVRIWGFGSVNTDPGPGSVFFQLLNSTGSYINYAANGIPRLDAVVSYAERNGVKIILNFVNNVGHPFPHSFDRTR